MSRHLQSSHTLKLPHRTKTNYFPQTSPTNPPTCYRQVTHGARRVLPSLALSPKIPQNLLNTVNQKLDNLPRLYKTMIDMHWYPGIQEHRRNTRGYSNLSVSLLSKSQVPCQMCGEREGGGGLGPLAFTAQFMVWNLQCKQVLLLRLSWWRRCRSIRVCLW